MKSQNKPQRPQRSIRMQLQNKPPRSIRMQVLEALNRKIALLEATATQLRELETLLLDAR